VGIEQCAKEGGGLGVIPAKTESPRLTFRERTAGGRCGWAKGDLFGWGIAGLRGGGAR
jgi:hypothetical protein